jgi:hypothetical protein
MGLINDELAAQLRQDFAGLVNPVRLAVCFQGSSARERSPGGLIV